MSSNILDADVNELSTASATPSLNDVARSNRETGVLLATKEQLVTAIQDRRCKREHLRVLAAVATFMNTATAKAWPGRAAIAGLLGFSAKTVSNTLTELRGWGYLVAEKESVPEANNRSLTVYTWGKIDHDTIRREIEAFVAGVREGRIPAKHHSDVPRPQGSSPPEGNNVPYPRGTPKSEVPSRGARKSPPAGDSNSYREQKKTSPSGDGAKAPIQPLDLQKMVWGPVLDWIRDCYGGAMPEVRLRSRLGQMVKEHSPEHVLVAVGKAQRSGTTIDPLNYIEGILRKSGHSNTTARADAKRKLDLI